MARMDEPQQLLSGDGDTGKVGCDRSWRWKGLKLKKMIGERKFTWATCTAIRRDGEICRKMKKMEMEFLISANNWKNKITKKSWKPKLYFWQMNVILEGEYLSKDKKVGGTFSSFASKYTVIWNWSFSILTLEEIFTPHDEFSVLSIPPARLLFIHTSRSAAIIDGFLVQQ